MELVLGIPITKYCARHELDTRQRLELFATVCGVVHHAHQKGVIHRDLKPSNLLVELHDVKHIPKVIDFGVAKAINRQLTERTLHTNIAQMIGTPLYMSPEQAELSGMDVDTRSDIYSLGVLLYELLTGTTPFSKEQLSETSFDEMRRIIREEDPPRPSDRISTLEAEARTTVSHRHRMNPRKLTHTFRGELDWMVMKALEKDRARRYESASALAADIQRYLDDEPVEACPPSAWYRIRKFARRHKAACVSTMAIVGGVILAMLAVTMVALNQRKSADRRLRIEQRVHVALTEVARLRGNDHEGTGKNAPDLARAQEFAQRALALAESGPVAPSLVARVTELIEQLEREIRESRLLVDLDRAWLAQGNLVGTWLDSDASIPIVMEALEEFGIVVGELPPERFQVRTRTRAARSSSELSFAIVDECANQSIARAGSSSSPAARPDEVFISYRVCSVSAFATRASSVRLSASSRAIRASSLGLPYLSHRIG